MYYVKFHKGDAICLYSMYLYNKELAKLNPRNDWHKIDFQDMLWNDIRSQSLYHVPFVAGRERR